jgi:hypothetical protein
VLTNDIRFQLHILLYQRLQTIWILFSTILCILPPILLNAHLALPVISGSCLLWILLQALGFVIGARCRKKVSSDEEQIPCYRRAGSACSAWLQQ